MGMGVGAAAQPTTSPCNGVITRPKQQQAPEGCNIVNDVAIDSFRPNDDDTDEIWAHFGCRTNRRDLFCAQFALLSLYQFSQLPFPLFLRSRANMAFAATIKTPLAVFSRALASIAFSFALWGLYGYVFLWVRALSDIVPCFATIETGSLAFAFAFKEAD